MTRISMRERKIIIGNIIRSEEFKAFIRDDPQFYFNYRNVALKIDEYAIENKLWERSIAFRSLMQYLTWYKEEMAVLEGRSPLDMRRQRKMRHQIIEDIMARDEFRKLLMTDNITKEAIYTMINDYSVKNGLWKEGISPSTLRADFTLLYY